MRHALAPLAIAVLALGLSACGGGGGEAPASVGNVVVVTDSNKVQSFDRLVPGTLIGSRAIFGLQPAETIAGIDYRPSNGQLYALGTRGNLYTLDPATGRATFRATLKAAAGDDLPFIALTGTQFGVDFNPVADRLRVVSNTGQNLRINVDTGDVITDGGLGLAGEVVIAGATAAAPSVTAAGYTQAFAGTTGTQLYVLDLTLGQLFLQDPPNSGTLTGGVSLGLVGSGVNGFDIESRTRSGYAVLTTGVGSVPTLYRIDLNATGQAATRVGAVAGGEAITGLALVQD